MTHECIELGNIHHLPEEQQSVLAERAQLAVRITEMTGFAQSEAFQGLEGGEQQRRTLQLDTMRIYHDVLLDRIAAF